jgi:hypothetical protein
MRTIIDHPCRFPPGAFCLADEMAAAWAGGGQAGARDGQDFASQPGPGRDPVFTTAQAAEQ